MRSIIFLVFVFCSSYSLQGQYVEEEAPKKKPDVERSGTIGVGFGNNHTYGGIGFRYTKKIVPGWAITGAAGINLVGLGFNVGVLKRFTVAEKFKFTAHGMYGSNAVVRVIPKEYSRTFYGPTVSFGCEIYNSRGNFFAPAFSIAFRNSEYFDFLEELAPANPDNPPVIRFPQLSTGFGYHF